MSNSKIQELKLAIAKAQKENNVTPKKFNVSEEGTILLDASKPTDMAWYEPKEVVSYDISSNENQKQTIGAI